LAEHRERSAFLLLLAADSAVCVLALAFVGEPGRLAALPDLEEAEEPVHCGRVAHDEHGLQRDGIVIDVLAGVQIGQQMELTHRFVELTALDLDRPPLGRLLRREGRLVGGDVIRQ